MQPPENNFFPIQPVRKPGFALRSNDTRLVWFVHCNDINGDPLLFSPLLEGQAAANTALNAILKALTEKRTEIRQEKDGWMFVVLGKDTQELGRSKIFLELPACEEALQYVQRVAASKKPLAEMPVAAEPPAPEKPSAETQHRLRHSFRLFFYENTAEKTISGRIENAQNPAAHAAFEGLDLQNIARFLKEQLPAVAIQMPEPTPAAVATEDIPKAEFGTSVGRLFLTDTHTAQRIITRSAQNRMQLILVSSITTVLKGVLQGTTLSAYTENGEQIQLPVLRAVLGDKGEIQLDLHADSSIPAGMCRLCASAWIQHGPASVHHLTGSIWLSFI